MTPRGAGTPRGARPTSGGGDPAFTQSSRYFSAQVTSSPISPTSGGGGGGFSPGWKGGLQARSMSPAGGEAMSLQGLSQTPAALSWMPQPHLAASSHSTAAQIASSTDNSIGDELTEGGQVQMRKIAPTQARPN